MNASLRKRLRVSESILQEFRPSPLRYRKAFLISTLVLLASFFLIYPLQTLGLLGWGIFAALSLPALAGFGRVALLWSRNVSILTNERLIDLEQRSLFHRQVAECSLDQIIDIRYNTSGLIPTLFRLGTVVIDNGNPRGQIEIQDIQHPQAVAEQIARVRRHHSKTDYEAQEI